MSRSGDEMMLELHNLLNKQGLVSTAAKKDDDKEDKKDDKDEKDLPPFMKKKEDDKDEKKDKKDDDKKKKKAVVLGVLHELTKLASELDEAGADDASSAVDEALRVIVRDIQNQKTE